jgi:hypothetical protein
MARTGVKTEHLASSKGEQALARAGLPHSQETEPRRWLRVVQVVTSDDAVGQEPKESAVRFRGQVGEGVLCIRNGFHVPILADGAAKKGRNIGDFQLLTFGV